MRFFPLANDPLHESALYAYAPAPDEREDPATVPREVERKQIPDPAGQVSTLAALDVDSPEPPVVVGRVEREQAAAGRERT